MQVHIQSHLLLFGVNVHLGGGGGGGGGSSVGRAHDAWSGDSSFNPRCGRPLPTGWVGDRSHGLSTLSRVWQHLKLSDVSLGARPRYSLVDDEDVKKPNKEFSSESLLHKRVVSSFWF